MLVNRQGIVHHRKLRYVAENPLGLQGFVPVRPDQDLTLEPEQPRDAFDRRGLSRSVGSHHQGDLSILRDKGNLAVCQNISVTLTQVIYCQHNCSPCIIISR